eukprot:CAMPEP_0172214016 /NCGR_PEP_ID=MMETSP1050-20130122/37923_1 /TAXON_ID=233186 /ORGANISM="Cryptomonas curvata, Strain CCAP979/52" /LENGTH=184 /DNA_ID=CAMNT_0012894931 /DNA_START=200 /DNA_END=749 /DNA_ORIENTATION=-
MDRKALWIYKSALWIFTEEPTQVLQEDLHKGWAWRGPHGDWPKHSYRGYWQCRVSEGPGACPALPPPVPRLSRAHHRKRCRQKDARQGLPHGAASAALGIEILDDADEWEGYEDVRGDVVVHVELRRWADALVVAPCSANTLAKAACGLCDNLITCVLRAWDPAKPVLVCPAMNTVMWEHPATR